MRSPDVVVRPLRFTNRIEAMTSFLEVVGLRSRVESERGGWVDMVAGAGMVALHSAEASATGGKPGETRLSFEGSDLDALAQRLVDAGFADATVWDESYGRVLSVTDPTGDQIWVDGYNDDDYGFEVHDPERDPRLRVMPIRFAEPAGPVAVLLESFGLERRAVGSSQHWATFGGHAGLVALHPPIDDNVLVDGPGTVQLAFETDEPLAEVADRLRAAGFPDTVVRPRDFGEELGITDPDGQPVAVYHPPLRHAS
jgi:hypothetical protein